MPELPEVETIRRQLQRVLPGRRLGSVLRVDPAVLDGVAREDLAGRLPGRSIEDLDRRGKYIVGRLSGELYLTIHLGMTGSLRVLTGAGPVGHERLAVRLDLERGAAGDSVERLAFIDARKFGRVRLTAGAPWSGLVRLGPDAWRGDWTADWLEERLRSRKAGIKSVLLEQKVMAGIGNIYADEILFAAGIDPRRSAGSLRSMEVKKLAESIRRRLDDGVRLRGCSISDYVDARGRSGSFQDELRAYGRHGQACVDCGSTLRRVVIAGRGTAYCPKCQR